MELHFWTVGFLVCFLGAILTFKINKELDVYYASCDFTSTELQNANLTFLSLVENQFVEILDSQDSRYYLVKTRPRKDENSKIGWIPACFLEKRSTSIGQVILKFKLVY